MARGKKGGGPRAADIALVVMSCSALLAGCSGLGIGESEYGCEGKPEGVRCISTRDAYTATEDRDRLGPTDGAGTGAPASPESGAASVASAAALERAPLPAVDGPIPLRTPSRVMRIRLNYWEDAAGDLHVPGYIYTEVEARRWEAGLPAQAAPPVLRPLQRSAPERAAESRRARGEAREGPSRAGPKNGMARDNPESAPAGAAHQQLRADRKKEHPSDR